MILGIESRWQVRWAKPEITRRLVVIEVEYDRGLSVRCPQCHWECPRHDHAPERTWGHLGQMQFTAPIGGG